MLSVVFSGQEGEAHLLPRYHLTSLYSPLYPYALLMCSAGKKEKLTYFHDVAMWYVKKACGKDALTPTGSVFGAGESCVMLWRFNTTTHQHTLSTHPINTSSNTTLTHYHHHHSHRRLFLVSAKDRKGADRERRWKHLSSMCCQSMPGGDYQNGVETGPPLPRETRKY